MDHVEILSRISISPWVTQLWTLQEGYLANKLYFQFKDQAYDGDQGLWLAGNDEERWRFPFLARVLMLFMQIRNSTLFGVPKEVSIPLSFFRRTLRNRQTTVPGDEPVCLATILDFNEASIQEIAAVPRNKVQERMKKFWQGFDEIPPHIPYFSGTKMQEKGFRWAPMTFMQPEGGISSECPSAPKTTLTSSGLCMTAQGFTLKRPQIVESSDDAPSTQALRFFFRDRQARWYLVLLENGEQQASSWLTTSAVRDLVLIPRGEVAAVSESTSSVGWMKPGVSPTWAIAAFVEEDEESEGNVEIDHDSTADTTTLPGNDSSLRSMHAATRLLSIGTASISKVQQLSHVRELEFRHGNRQLSKVAMRETRQILDYRSMEETMTATSAWLSFSNITGECEAKTWCFTCEPWSAKRLSRL